MDDLVERKGLYYKQFTDVPFTGEVTGDKQGSFKNGKKEGTWVRYWNNGQLMYKGNFKNGQFEGYWSDYNYDGTVYKEWTGTYKDGVKISD